MTGRHMYSTHKHNVFEGLQFNVLIQENKRSSNYLQEKKIDVRRKAAPSPQLF